MSDGKPIIVIKKKGGHGGHHGGAWKVAYADFVTAMMAFFMVMWLVNSADTVTKENIASYFKRPGLFDQGSGTPLLIGQAGILQDSYSAPKSSKNKHSHSSDTPSQSTKDQQVDLSAPVIKPADGGENKGTGEREAIIKLFPKEEVQKKPNFVRAKEKQDQDADQKEALPENEQQQELEQAFERQKKELADIAKRIQQEIKSTPELQELLGLVEVKFESDGLNIEIIDTDKTSMFALGSARILPDAQEAFEKIAEIVTKIPNKIEIAGHTDAKPFSTRTGGYSNWELSSDRANAARRLLEQFGVDSARLGSVIGKADTELKNKEDPFASSNRRITFKIKFTKPQTVRLDKDPNALKNININPETDGAKSDQSNTISLPAGKTPQDLVEQKEKEEPADDGIPDRYIPKKIVKASKAKQKLLELPDDEAESSGGGSSDNLFGDTPVVGSEGFFDDF